MDFLMDYLPAIQFAAALNIGYIIPDIMMKMNSVLNNINNGYVDILQDVRNRIIVKSQEVGGACVVETTDKRTTRGYIDKQLNDLKKLKEGCDEKEESLGIRINKFVNCSGYRSVFFYSALFSVMALLVIPFCHQHVDAWAFRWFFYVMNSISLIYLIVLFVVVIRQKRDISCRSVFGLFMLFFLVAIITAYVNSLLPVSVEITEWLERYMSLFSVVVPFLPGVGCMLFLMVLVYHSVLVAHSYSLRARFQFWRINRAMKKLNIINELFKEDLTVK